MSGTHGRPPARRPSQRTGQLRILSNEPEQDVEQREEEAPTQPVYAATVRTPDTEVETTEEPAPPPPPAAHKIPSKRQPVSATASEADVDEKPIVAPPAKAVSKRVPLTASAVLGDEARRKKIIIGLSALVAVLLCVVAGILIKKSRGSGSLAVKHVDGADGAGNGTDIGEGNSPALQVSLANAQFRKERPRSNTNLLLASGGATVSNCANPQFLNDGNSIDYDGGNGYSYCAVGPDSPPMTVTLKDPHEMTRVRFLLWDKDDRTYRYVLMVSPDGKKWNKIKDNTRIECNSWQEFKFPRQKVKAVAIRGIANSNGDPNLHVVELEGYDDGEATAKLTPRVPLKGPAKVSVSSMKPGVWAQYFDGCDSFAMQEDAPDLTRVQSSLAFGASMPPQKDMSLHDFPFSGPCAAIFQGFLKIERANLYTFFVQSENGARLYLDGELLISNEGQRLQEVWEQVDLSPGMHRLWVEYYTRGTVTALNVSIKPKGESKEYISDTMLMFDPAEIGSIDSDGRHSPHTVRDAPKPYVKFLNRDEKRGGAWHGVVGRDGYVIFNKNGGGQHLMKLPPYVASVTSAADHCVWQVGADPRGLEEPAGGGQRLCSCEYSGSEIIFDIKSARPTPHRLSLYLLDFDKLKRLEKVHFFSGDALLYEMDCGDISNGVWLQFECAGPLTIHISLESGPNAVAAGLFWDSEKPVRFREPAAGPPTGELKPGILAEYFDGLVSYPTEEDTPTLFRLEKTVSFGASTPPSGERFLKAWPLAESCAAIFRGAIKIPQDEKITLSLESDDGSRLYIDGAKVVDNDGSHGMKEVDGSVDLKAGPHRIWVEYYNSGGPMGLNLWLKKDGKKSVVPPEMLFHE